MKITLTPEQFLIYVQALIDAEYEKILPPIGMDKGDISFIRLKGTLGLIESALKKVEQPFIDLPPQYIQPNTSPYDPYKPPFIPTSTNNINNTK